MSKLQISSAFEMTCGRGGRTGGRTGPEARSGRLTPDDDTPGIRDWPNGGGGKSVAGGQMQRRRRRRRWRVRLSLRMRTRTRTRARGLTWLLKKPLSS